MEEIRAFPERSEKSECGMADSDYGFVSASDTVEPWRYGKIADSSVGSWRCYTARDAIEERALERRGFRAAKSRAGDLEQKARCLVTHPAFRRQNPRNTCPS